MSAEYVDVRSTLSKRTHGVLTAKAMQSGKTMQDILREVTDKWAEEEIHAATLILRLVGVDGFSTASDGMAAASGGMATASDGTSRKTL